MPQKNHPILRVYLDQFTPELSRAISLVGELEHILSASMPESENNVYIYIYIHTIWEEVRMSKHLAASFAHDKYLCISHISSERNVGSNI